MNKQLHPIVVVIVIGVVLAGIGGLFVLLANQTPTGPNNLANMVPGKIYRPSVGGGGNSESPAASASKPDKKK